MELPIKNINDLRSEIYRLKGLEKEQGAALGQRFRNPSAVFSTIVSLFRRTDNADGTKGAGFFDQDLAGLLSRFVLPFTLNKTIFRNSGFIVKTIVSLVSQKASHFINEDVVAGLWEKVSGLFKGKNGEEVPDHRGIPPLSETY